LIKRILIKIIDPFRKLIKRLFPNLELFKIPIFGPLAEKTSNVLKLSYVENVHGHKMYLDEADSLKLSWGGSHEPFETQFFEENIKPGDVVVDIGANIGYYTLYFAKKVSSQGHIYAFEPDPVNFELLEKNIEINGYKNITAVNKALSNKNEKLKLYICEENRGDHRTYDSQQGREFVEINATHLDDYFADIDNHIDLIKMDIQGAEYKAIQGMEEILRKNQGVKLVIEFWPYGLSLAGTDAKDLFSLLQDLGFSIFEISEKNRSIQETTIEKLLQLITVENQRFTNLLCVKRE
jgi:FkbM family methyltransferase